MTRKRQSSTGSPRSSKKRRHGQSDAAVPSDFDTAVEVAGRHIRATLDELFTHDRPADAVSALVPLSRLLTHTQAADPTRFTAAVTVKAVQKLIDGGVLGVDFVQPPSGPGPHRLDDDPLVRALLAVPTTLGPSAPAAARIAELADRVRLVRVYESRPVDAISPAEVAGAVAKIRAGLAARFADALLTGMNEAARAEVGRLPLLDVLLGLPGDRPPRYAPAVYVAAADRLIADGDLVYEVVGAPAGSAPVNPSDDSLVLHMLTSGLMPNVILKDGDRFLKVTNKFIGELTDEGKVVGRTVIVEARDLSPEQRAVVDELPVMDGLGPAGVGPMPKWAGRVLTYEKWSCDYRELKGAPSQEALLDAFEEGGWETPLKLSSLHKGKVGNLESTVKHLKKRVNRNGPAPITFKALGEERAEWRPAKAPPTPPAVAPQGNTRKPAANGQKKSSAKRKPK